MTPPPLPRRRRRRSWPWLLLLLLASGLGAGAVFWFHRGDDAIPVQVVKVGRRDIAETVMANGRIQPITQVVISPEVAGEIVELPVVEGQPVKKGDLLLQIKPDNYLASKNSAEANYKFAQGSRNQAEAELGKAEMQFRQNDELRKNKLISDSVFIDFKTTFEVARLRLTNAVHQADQAKFALEKAEDDLSKTTIRSPIDGTVTKLKSQLGERVLGTSFNMGTEVLTVARLDEVEARVDIGEVDIVLIKVGQVAKLEVDAFKDRVFKGTVSAIANASKSMSQSALVASSNTSQEAPKFEVRIMVEEKEAFRPGMSVTAEIETRERKNALAVPIQSVTTRLPRAESTPAATPKAGKQAPVKPAEVVFAMEGDHVKAVPVKTGIADNDFYEIVSGLSEGQEIVSGGYKAISKDLEEGKKVKRSTDAAKLDVAPK
jgi:HlyD family secretion protein